MRTTVRATLISKRVWTGTHDAVAERVQFQLLGKARVNAADISKRLAVVRATVRATIISKSVRE
jgi:hypothetical protein